MAFKVLVVEDEPILRMMAVDLVEEAGLEAVEAADADEAIRFLESDPDIRILFSDIQMPGSMDGLKLAEAVRDRWPPVEIILVSGHCGRGDVTLKGRDRFFPKPYNGREIVSTLQDLAA